MGVLVYIPHILRNRTEDQEIVEVKGQNVGDCLQNLVQRYPELKTEIFKNGKLQSHIEIYVNMQSSYPQELAKPVQDGDEIHITLMLSGG